MFGQNRRGYGGRGVYIHGDSYQPELQYLGSFLGVESVLIDIGASTGVYSLKAAKEVGPRGIVIAIDPSLEVLATLHQSIGVNKLANIRVRNICVGKETGIRTLWLNNDRPNSFSMVNRVDSAIGISVLTVALDDLCQWEKLDRLDYLKISTVGAEREREREILAGASQTIERYRPIVRVATSYEDIAAELVGYRALKERRSPNKVYVPQEHGKLHVFSEHGWRSVREG